MEPSFEELEFNLRRAPEDWSARLRMIEEYLWRDQIDEAKRLVREAPGESPLPLELQERLHRLMTEGKEAIEREINPGYIAIPLDDVIELKAVNGNE